VKRAACASAVIPLIEVPAKFSQETLIELLELPRDESTVS
jgi:hypothetical protein